MKLCRVETFLCLLHLLAICGCTGNSTGNSLQTSQPSSAQQTALSEAGWYSPRSSVSGEFPKEYGVVSKYGQQDNYFDIELGKGCDVAVKIMDMKTDRCIRYVYVPENSTVNIQMIPQGQYYIKLAYGKNWIQFDNEDGSIQGRFADIISYERSTDVFDFGKKNSANIVSYELKINVKDSNLQNNFNTTEISEKDFNN